MPPNNGLYFGQRWSLSESLPVGTVIKCMGGQQLVVQDDMYCLTIDFLLTIKKGIVVKAAKWIEVFYPYPGSDLYEQPITVKYFSTRIVNALQRYNVTTVGQLSEKTAEWILDIRNIGYNSLVEIEYVLNQYYGLSLTKKGSSLDKED